jgi:hypothetical protein
VIAGEGQPDDGQVTVDPGMAIGYFSTRVTYDITSHPSRRARSSGRESERSETVVSDREIVFTYGTAIGISRRLSTSIGLQ